MDAYAARRGRQKAFKADLAEVIDDDEACPPEWVDLTSRVRQEKAAIDAAVDEATLAFVEEPDIRRALAKREAFVGRTRERIAALNTMVLRLNLLAPHSRFTRAGLDAEETLRPLFRSRRAAGNL
jgi:hypothetical protein